MKAGMIYSFNKYDVNARYILNNNNRIQEKNCISSRERNIYYRLVFSWLVLAGF